MAGNDVFLYSVPTDANSADVRLRDPTTAASGSGSVTGSLAATLDAVLLSSASTLAIAAASAPTLGTLTLSSAGQVVIDGDLASTLGAVTLSASGALPIAGALGATLGDVSLSAASTIADPASAISGALDATLDGVTLGATATIAEPASEVSSTGGGGGFRMPSAAERKRYQEYAKRLVEKRVEQDTEETRQLEIAWNKANGIEAPEVVEVPAKIAAFAETIPKKVSVDRSRKLAQLTAMVADFRAEAARLAEQQRARDEEDEIAVLMLLAA